jgi:YHS domain-containing protein
MKFLIVRLLLPLLLFLVLRSVLRGLFSSSTTTPERARQAPPKVPDGGELRKDPVCGTYVSVLAGVQGKVKGETVYFCSTDCRDRYRG